MRAIHRSMGIWMGMIFSTIAVCDEPEVTNMRAIHDQIFHYRIQSPALNKLTSFTAVVPKEYSDTGAPWPVVYLLHGAGRNHFSLTDFETTRETLLAARFVTIMPYGENGWWIDSPVSAQSQFETFIDEVIQVSEKHLNISKLSKQRGITGWSMGGFGAIRYAERHANRFIAAAAILGLLDFPNFSLPTEQNHSVPSIFGTTQEQQESFNPLPLAANLKSMCLFLTTADQAFDFTMNEHFHEKLTELDIPHQYKVFEGSHTFSIVEESLPLVVDFFHESFSSVSVNKNAQCYQ